ncbi:TPA: 50S ribosomal protein L34e [Candidatus Woesearchaeota archaeon]|nr:50S ribosomal protein L34e [archaeon GW2011_AR15]MBS3103548.1 50S ribosomal protein L34e [Candidatus Woesearchaeota archaeon]HIH41348.1 50S ribosomal protein L34e [Candidatus Woesearchaeota archaeon]
MPEPRFRSRTYRRITKKLPGGDHVIHYAKRKPGVAKCAKCGASLKGIPRERPYKMQILGKSKKRNERPYGGNLCSKCSRQLIKKEARQ